MSELEGNGSGQISQEENAQRGSSQELRGAVKWFDTRSGFGFITTEEAEGDILLHVNVLRAVGRSSLAEGTELVVRVVETPRGLQAVEILDLFLPEESAEGDVLSPKDYPTLPLEPARVKWFDRRKGFGFVNIFGAPDDIFVHMETLRRCGLADLVAGEAVAVKVEQGPRGRHAVGVWPWELAEDNGGNGDACNNGTNSENGVRRAS